MDLLLVPHPAFSLGSLRTLSLSKRRTPQWRRFLALILALLAIAGPPAVRAGDKETSQPLVVPSAIWSGLVLATNAPAGVTPTAPVPQLAPYAEKLQAIFGYNQCELIGENEQKMDDKYERWLIPSQDFSLSVKMRNEPGKHYPMKLVLFQGRKKLAEFESHLAIDIPLFIRGPQYAGGQLIIVLHTVEPEQMASPWPPRPRLSPASPARSRRTNSRT